ncbi:SH3 domain-containing protein [Ureibacillus sp. MALMAid1270]|uniref:SH3 domain-containing protein n=1 Tax=Ureibacillus sp. MALMAid1270 TaxID=3411629 RepID=UPI003BA6CE2F
MKKIVAGVVCAFILFNIIIFSQKQTETVTSNKSGELIVVNKKLNLREGPGLAYPVTSSTNEGQALSKLEQQGEWILVANGESEGWIPSWHTSTDDQVHSTKIKVAIANVDGLNVRAQPTTSSAVLKQLSIGDELIVKKEDEQWSKVEDSTGTTGWVSNNFITITEKTSEEIEESPNLDAVEEQSHFTVRVASANVRNEPNLSSSVVGSAHQDDTFEVIEQKNNWIKIQLSDDEVGWIYRFYGMFDSSVAANSDRDTVTIIYGGTNLRESPSTSSAVVKRADLGETFEILSSEGEWYKVAINSTESAYVAQWVVSSNLRKQDSETDTDLPKIERKKGTLNGVTIVLDPGHGGNDQGTSGYRGSIEKDYTLITTQMLQSKLQNAGATVYLTRESDMYVDLRKRVSISHQYAADAFISIHYDATEDSTISGFTTYYYHDYQQELAQYVNDGLAKKVTLRDRGSQEGNYLVLRENYQNGILIELGYLSNPTEERVITTEFYREQATLGIYEGIIDYFDAKLE